MDSGRVHSNPGSEGRPHLNVVTTIIHASLVASVWLPMGILRGVRPTSARPMAKVASVSASLFQKESQKVMRIAPTIPPLFGNKGDHSGPYKNI
jgi:hypothetical protein